LDDAEYRRVGADAERQRENGNGGEARRSLENSEPVPDLFPITA